MFVLLYEILWEITQIITPFANQDCFTFPLQTSHFSPTPEWKSNPGLLALWTSIPPVSHTPAQAMHFSLVLLYQLYNVRVVREERTHPAPLYRCHPQVSPSLPSTDVLCQVKKFLIILCSLRFDCEWELDFIKLIFCTNNILVQIFFSCP